MLKKRISGTMIRNFGIMLVGVFALSFAACGKSRSFTDMEKIAAYLSKASGTMENPIPLPVKIHLGTMTNPDGGWHQLLAVISKADKPVALDLSACTMNETEFNPDSSVKTGKHMIISLVLPAIAESIANGFEHFDNLMAISAKVTSIGDEVFSGRTSLTNIDFPVATDIGDHAFFRCTGLTIIDFPAVTYIGDYAFGRCTGLTSIHFPATTNIGDYAFERCIGLTSIDFPAVTNIDTGAFAGCSLNSITIAELAYIVGYGSLFAFKEYYLSESGGNKQAGTYTWNGSAWTGPGTQE